MMLEASFIYDRLCVAWSNIIAQDLDVQDETIEALEEIIRAYGKLREIELDRQYDKKKLHPTEEELEEYYKTIEKTYAVLNAPVGKGTVKDLIAYHFKELDQNKNTVDHDLTVLKRRLHTTWNKDDLPINSAHGRYVQAKRENRKQWKKMEKAYRTMEDYLTAISDDPKLSDEDKVEVAAWKKTFHDLAEGGAGSANAVKRVSAKGRFDAFLKRPVGSKNILHRIEKKAKTSSTKKIVFCRALFSIKDFHKIKLDYKKNTCSAYEWIDSINTKDSFIMKEKGKTIYKTHSFAVILAARQLANAQKGNARNLRSTKLTCEEILARADKIKKEPVYQEFIKTLEKDENAMKKAIGAACKGHGGDFESQFMDFVKKQPAGELPNKPIFERYMPIVKERITFLQKQADKGGDRVKILAEMTALRKIARVKSETSVSLNVAIPVDKRNTLQGSIFRIIDDPTFKKVAS